MVKRQILNSAVTATHLPAHQHPHQSQHTAAGAAQPPPGAMTPLRKLAVAADDMPGGGGGGMQQTLSPKQPAY